jgi:signal transduction histidine kinase
MNSLAWALVGATVATLVALVVSRTRTSPRFTDPLSPTERTDLAEMERDRRRSTEIIERMAEGVLVLNEALTPVLANGSARSLLALPETDLPMRIAADEVVAVARRALDDQVALEEVAEVWFPNRMALRVHAAPLEDRGVVVVLQDVTQELLTQRIRKEFAASASHELKSPVASIQALAEALQDAARRDPEVAVRFADQIVTETQRLARLTSSLIDLSRLEEAAEAPKEVSDISRVATDVVEALRDAVEDAEVTLELDIEDRLQVRGDDAQLALMIRNLLDNAIRYTPRGGVIGLRLHATDDEVVLTVSDNGIGIPKESHERIFERFYRADSGRSREMGGTGLGLAIVKHVVERHGGRIELESEVGEGTTFTVTLPAVTREARRTRRTRAERIA